MEPLCLDTTDRTGGRVCVRVRGDVDSDGVPVLVSRRTGRPAG